MSRIILLIASVVVVVFGAAAHEEEDPLSTYMHCLFVEKGCTDAQVAQLQMQVAGYVATIDDQEALGLGGPPDQQKMAGASPTMSERSI